MPAKMTDSICWNDELDKAIQFYGNKHPNEKILYKDLDFISLIDKNIKINDGFPMCFSYEDKKIYVLTEECESFGNMYIDYTLENFNVGLNKEEVFDIFIKTGFKQCRECLCYTGNTVQSNGNILCIPCLKYFIKNA